MITHDRPARDVVEVSVFGNGDGESLVIHLGDNRWMIVDSLKTKSSPSEPVALAYLRQIKVDPRAVAVVAATHYDTDHIRGISKVLTACKRAKFVTPAIFTDRRFQEALDLAAPLHDDDNLNTKLTEFKALAQILMTRRNQKKRLRLAIEGAPVYTDDDVRIRSWSPSCGVAWDTLAYVVRQSRPGWNGRIPSENHISVVLSVEMGDRRVLLGGDLPAGSGGVSGWSAVIARAREERYAERGEVYKVPHHGSVHSDVDDVWEELLVDDPHAPLTTKRSSGLPRPSDRKTLRRRTPNAVVVGTKPRMSGTPTEGESLQLAFTDRLEPLTGPIGHIRARAPLNGPAAWTVVRTALTTEPA